MPPPAAPDAEDAAPVDPDAGPAAGALLDPPLDGPETPFVPPAFVDAPGTPEPTPPDAVELAPAVFDVPIFVDGPMVDGAGAVVAEPGDVPDGSLMEPGVERPGTVIDGAGPFPFPAEPISPEGFVAVVDGAELDSPGDPPIPAEPGVGGGDAPPPATPELAPYCAPV